jgi:hypothetical protein
MSTRRLGRLSKKETKQKEDDGNYMEVDEGEDGSVKKASSGGGIVE